MRDAQQVEFPSTHLQRLEPKSPLVWIRVNGQWREGRITKWVKTGEHWVIWATYQDDSPHPSHAWLLYEPETIRPRESDEPPADYGVSPTGIS